MKKRLPTRERQNHTINANETAEIFKCFKKMWFDIHWCIDYVCLDFKRLVWKEYHALF